MLLALIAQRPGWPARLGHTLVLLCLGLLVLAACRRDDPATDAALTIELVAPLCSPPVGSGELVVRVADAAGAPVDDARLAIRGDMTHAGMIPLLAAADRGEAGLYHVPVEWSMAGEWIITVDATLSDDTHASRQFDLSVGAEEEPCSEE